jgi:ESCRT-II complex subunit VPS25
MERVLVPGMLVDSLLEFHGMDPEVLQKALHVLVKRGKAQVFGQEDQQGVKFF